MKLISLAIFSIVLCAPTLLHAQTLPGSSLKEKSFELKIVTKKSPSLSQGELLSGVDFMNAYIGSYPPRFKDEAERQKIYEKWLTLVSEAEAFAKVNKDSEASLSILSDFYRQGHNMDVIGSGEKARENLESCLKTYENSNPCNLSAVYFYLSIAPTHLTLNKAEKSLSILRNNSKPKLNHEAESGYVFLHLYRQDTEKANQQIEYFIENFPKSNRNDYFKLILNVPGKITIVEE